MKPAFVNAFLPPVLAATGFGLLTVVFVTETLSFSRAVETWARRVLAARAEAVSVTLREPLETQDFRALAAFGRTCLSNEVRLTVLSARGGVVYDAAAGAASDFSEEVPCGEWRVRLSLDTARVRAPFRRAVAGFALAGLLGAAGMLLVFFTLYRQRVRLRELTELERFRSTFIADVSHEIKTPLTGILGCTDLLKEESLDSEGRRRVLDMLADEARRLDGLAQDILALAKIEAAARQKAMAREPCDLAALAQAAVARFADAAARAGVRVRCEAPAPVVVAGDAEQLERLLANLLRNVLIHAEATEACVAVRAAASGRGGEISVTDDGTGVPKALRPHLFERFRRADASRSSETGGSGLGLAIARGIARLHGGDIRYEPVAPHGSRFVATIPGDAIGGHAYTA